MIAAAGAVSAAEPGGGWHIVRPGENLHLIAERYLGSIDRWPELARLNPEIQNPNRLEPGQRVRVSGSSDTAAARVTRLSRKVEAQPTPIPWEDARQDDLLLDRDGLRTSPKSSAEMAFTDGTRLLITESSLVFLQKTGGQLRGVDRKSVEIVEGQADVEARPAGNRSARPEVEIVLGSTRATTRPAPAGGSRTRARRADAGGAKLMVYGGEGEVEAAGAKVTVPEGMGTSVEAQGPPGPPEKLLPAPQTVAPAAGSQAGCANPRFAWTGVPEAASYTIEVCRDPSCGALLERAVGIERPEWRPAALPRGDHYWRVTARSRSGLDGYPSEPVRLTIASDRADLEGPRETPEIEGPQILVGEALWAGPAARVVVKSIDRETGNPVTREVTRTPEELGAFAARGAQGGDQDGAPTSTSDTSDSCGNAGSLRPLAFTVDAQAPEITWEVVDLDQFPNRRKGARTPKGLSWSGGARWMRLEEGGEPVHISSDSPQLLLHGARFDLGTEQVSPGADQMLRVRVRDAGAGVAHLSFQLRGDALEVEVADMVGNSRKMAWGVGR
jgi:hypothetical protein